eukprot:21095-Heterococcus_DN1.PRE.3
MHALQVKLNCRGLGLQPKIEKFIISDLVKTEPFPSATVHALLSEQLNLQGCNDASPSLQSCSAITSGTCAQIVALQILANSEASASQCAVFAACLQVAKQDHCL